MPWGAFARLLAAAQGGFKFRALAGRQYGSPVMLVMASTLMRSTVGVRMSLMSSSGDGRDRNLAFFAAALAFTEAAVRWMKRVSSQACMGSDAAGSRV